MKEDLMERLKDTDLVETIRKFEKEEVDVGYLLKVARTTAEIYGSKYVTDLGREMVLNPQHPRFRLAHNQVFLARYWMLFIGKLYQAAPEQEFLDFISGFLTHSDERIKAEAINRLKRLGIDDPLSLLDE